MRCVKLKALTPWPHWSQESGESGCAIRWVSGPWFWVGLPTVGSSRRNLCAGQLSALIFVRDVTGRDVIIGAGGVRSVKPFAHVPERLCVFEYIYFARPE